jgi:hypothetical protein
MEETLAKRKAELRESEKLLKDCEDDILKAKNEVKIFLIELRTWF